MSNLLLCDLSRDEWAAMQAAQQNGTWPGKGLPVRAIGIALLTYQMVGKDVRPVFRLHEPAQQKWMEAS